MIFFHIPILFIYNIISQVNNFNLGKLNMKEEGLIIFHNEEHPELKIDSGETDVSLGHICCYTQGEMEGEINEKYLSMDKSLEN